MILALDQTRVIFYGAKISTRPLCYIYIYNICVPARHISEGAVSCPYCLAPCPIIQHPARILFKKNKKHLLNVIAVFVFSDRGVKMLVECLQICAHVFIDRPQNCAQTSFRSCAGLRSNFGHSRSKLCPIMCRSRTKLYPNFGCSHARLCPISFAPCPFPNLAGTLYMTHEALSFLSRERNIG